MALYRKYRPASFAEVVGQEHVTEPLSAALSSGRINHAYLFSGPRGCGKTSSARILARSLNCVEGPTATPCGVCESCVALAPGGPGNLDVTELDAASHGGVDDTRELRERAFFSPASSRYRVLIIDEAHMVTTAGFNALLKIVEEPPEHLIFIFATTEPEKVLPTIRSRTHHYPFRLLTPTAMRSLVERICEQEQVSVEPAVLPLVIRAGGGSPRDTLSVLDQLIAGADEGGVTYARAVGLLGATEVALIDSSVDAIAAGDGASLFRTVDRVVEAGHDPRRFAQDLLQRLRDLIMVQSVPQAVERGLVDAPGEQADTMERQAELLGPATLARCADMVHEGLAQMRGATSPRLLLEILCARLLLPGADDSMEALLQRVESLERGAPVRGAAVEPGAGTGAAAVGGGSGGAPGPEGSVPGSGGDEKPRFVRRSQQKASGENSGPADGGAAGAGGGAASGAGATRGGESVGSVPAGDAAVPTGAAAPVDADVEPVVVPEVSGTGSDDGEFAAAPVSGAAAGRSGTGETGSRPAADPDGTDPGGSEDPWANEGAAADEDPEIAVAEGTAEELADAEGTADAGEATGTGVGTAVAVGAASAGVAAGAAASADEEDRQASSDTASPGVSEVDEPEAATPAPESAAPGRTEAAESTEASAPQAREPEATATEAAAPKAPETEAPEAEAEAPEPEPAPAPESVPAGIGAEDVRRVWNEVRAAVRRRTRTVEVMLAGASVAGVDGSEVHLVHDYAPLAARLGQPHNASAIADSIGEVLGGTWTIRSTPAGESGPPAGGSSEPAADPARGARQAGPGARRPTSERPTFERRSASSAGSSSSPGGSPDRGAGPAPYDDLPPPPEEPEPDPGEAPPDLPPEAVAPPRDQAPVSEDEMMDEARSGPQNLDRRTGEEIALQLLRDHLGARPLER